MNISYIQKEAIERIITSLQKVLAEEQVNFLYSEDVSLSKQIRVLEDDLRRRIELILDELSSLVNQNKEFEKRIHTLEHVIEPDKTDVYNIQKQIERLAQRIALLESNSQKGWWPFERGGIVK